MWKVLMSHCIWSISVTPWRSAMYSCMRTKRRSHNKLRHSSVEGTLNSSLRAKTKNVLTQAAHHEYVRSIAEHIAGCTRWRDSPVHSSVNSWLAVPGSWRSLHFRSTVIRSQEFPHKSKPWQKQFPHDVPSYAHQQKNEQQGENKRYDCQKEVWHDS